MALRKKLRDYLAKRDLLHHPRTPRETLLECAGELWEEARYADALEFYHRADSPEGLAKVKEHALREGGGFLLAQLERLRPGLVTAEDWKALLPAAERKGRYADIQMAERRAAGQPIHNPDVPPPPELQMQLELLKQEAEAEKERKKSAEQ